jgi:hypothetical protein
MFEQAEQEKGIRVEDKNERQACSEEKQIIAHLVIVRLIVV